MILSFQLFLFLFVRFAFFQIFRFFCLLYSHRLADFPASFVFRFLFSSNSFFDGRCLAPYTIIRQKSIEILTQEQIPQPNKEVFAATGRTSIFRRENRGKKRPFTLQGNAFYDMIKEHQHGTVAAKTPDSIRRNEATQSEKERNIMEELKLITASNLIRLRTAAGLTQAELGKRINYSDKSISKWERGVSLR